MRACIQRVSRAHVRIDKELVGQIDRGLVVLLGIAEDDTYDDLHYLVDKTLELRVFEDDAGKMNRSVQEIGGGILVVSQFTLFGDCRRGRRPSFTEAASPDKANELYQAFIRELSRAPISIQSGRFREHMLVELVNDGPVTLLLDSRKLF